MTHVHKNVVKTKAVIFINLNNISRAIFGVLNKEKKRTNNLLFSNLYPALGKAQES
jgi:hypothetical protein